MVCLLMSALMYSLLVSRATYRGAHSMGRSLPHVEVLVVPHAKGRRSSQLIGALERCSLALSSSTAANDISQASMSTSAPAHSTAAPFSYTPPGRNHLFVPGTAQ
ncbi:hypothetical protein HaLaN_25928 [Haematococcus lacustris]|uniref:Secreted protein n=1 Tax=Haematococcus lacustris TaxID=44745 RepID=A0A699ZY31_HAELA|nr:hypothetical protein HaLaN_25928 [Haematococcus lacustris]